MITAIIFIVCLVIWGVICFCAGLKESDGYWKPVVNRLQNELRKGICCIAHFAVVLGTNRCVGCEAIGKLSRWGKSRATTFI